MSKVINLAEGWKVRKDINANGRNKKYWFEHEDGRMALFKFPTRQEKGILKDYVSEVIGSKIANILEVPCAKVDFAIYNEQIGALSHNMLEENETLIDCQTLMAKKPSTLDKKPVASFIRSLRIFGLMGKDNLSNQSEKTIENVDVKKYTIDNVLDVYEEINLDKEFVDIVFFHALIGNNDFNQSNHGITFNQDTLNYELSKQFDLSSSLGISKMDDILQYVKDVNANPYLNEDKRNKTIEKKISNIVRNSSSKIQLRNNNNVNHFDIVGHVFEKYPEESQRALNKIRQKITRERISELLSDIPENILSTEEKEIMNIIILMRKEKIMEFNKKFVNKCDKNMNVNAQKEVALCI